MVPSTGHYSSGPDIRRLHLMDDWMRSFHSSHRRTARLSWPGCDTRQGCGHFSNHSRTVVDVWRHPVTSHHVTWRYSIDVIRRHVRIPGMSVRRDHFTIRYLIHSAPLAASGCRHCGQFLPLCKFKKLGSNIPFESVKIKWNMCNETCAKMFRNIFPSWIEMLKATWSYAK